MMLFICKKKWNTIGSINKQCYEGIELVFTEVKYRSNCSYGFPQEAVNKKKQHKINSPISNLERVFVKRSS